MPLVVITELELSGRQQHFGVTGRCAEQRIAMDLLDDPDIGIVSLGGAAGTGKSVLALAAGLEAVVERGTHQGSSRPGRSTPSEGRRSATCRAARPRSCTRGGRRSSTPSSRAAPGT